MGTKFKLTGTSILVSVLLFRSTVVPMWNPLDPFGSMLADMANALRGWYASMLVWLVDLVTTIAVPSPLTLVNEFFSFALGGTYGLARVLVVFIAVMVALVIILSPTARHGVKIQRLLTSIFMVILLGWVFFPLYGLLYNLSKAGVGAAKALLTTEGETIYDAVMRLFGTLNIVDAINTIIATGISGVFGVFLAGTAVWLFVTSIVVMIGYPLAIAIRPLGKFGNTVFNLFNAAILTTLLSPTIMAFLFMAPLFIQKYIPGMAIVATPFFALVGSLGALLTPYVIFFMSFRKSSEVFGRLDDASGQLDIGHMPPVSVEEIQNDVSVTNNMNASAIIADAVGDSLLYNDGSKGLFDDIIKKGVDIGATAATAAGHPYVGFAAKAAGGVYANLRNDQKDMSAHDDIDIQQATEPKGGDERGQ